MTTPIDIENDDDTILTGNIADNDVTMSPMKNTSPKLSSTVKPDQEVFKSVSDVINSKDKEGPLERAKQASAQTTLTSSAANATKVGLYNAFTFPLICVARKNGSGFLVAYYPLYHSTYIKSDIITLLSPETPHVIAIILS